MREQKIVAACTIAQAVSTVPHRLADRMCLGTIQSLSACKFEGFMMRNSLHTAVTLASRRVTVLQHEIETASKLLANRTNNKYNANTITITNEIWHAANKV
jgi:hypothetical protein